MNNEPLIVTSPSGGGYGYTSHRRGPLFWVFGGREMICSGFFLETLLHS